MAIDKGPVTIGKVAILVLGVVILGVGLHSHFKSGWTESLGGSQHVYDVCKVPVVEVGLKELGKKCPSISLEKYYVAMIIICFIISLLGLVAGFVLDLSSSPLKLADAGYHGVAAILLFIAAIVFIVSASQIKSLISLVTLLNTTLDKLFNFRTSEKIAAGALTIIQSALYGVVAFLIVRS